MVVSPLTLSPARCRSRANLGSEMSMLARLVFVLLAGASASDGGSGAPQRKMRPVWQARLATTSIATVARREQRNEWNEVRALPSLRCGHAMLRG